MIDREPYRILSQPCVIRWAGWESTTTMLQRCGWEFVVKEDPFLSSIELMMRHKETRFVGICRNTHYDYRRLRIREMYQSSVLPVFHVTHVLHENAMTIRITHPADGYLGSFVRADMEPQWDRCEEVRIPDLRLFADMEAPAKEQLIIEPATVAELLAKIRTMQAPEQARIRANAARHRHAEIITLDDYRVA